MADGKPLVLVLGATGSTGQSIVKGLLASGQFRVAAMVRPASLRKPGVEDLRVSGVEVRHGDLNDGFEKLKKVLEGVDILISAIVAWAIVEQRDIIHAAKDIGVQRVVPCDFGTPGAKGVRALHDSKLAIREYIKELGLPHTFIDVGWWMELFLPLPDRSAASPEAKAMTRQVYGKGETRCLLTDLRNIGKYVARIVADPRTLNHAVITWDDETTKTAAYKLGERFSEEGDAFKAHISYAAPDEYLKGAAAGRELAEKDPKDFGAHVAISWNEYMQSIYVLEENTLENAKNLGYLDVRELYPDIQPLGLEDYAQEFYGRKEPGAIYVAVEV